MSSLIVKTGHIADNTLFAEQMFGPSNEIYDLGKDALSAKFPNEVKNDTAQPCKIQMNAQGEYEFINDILMLTPTRTKANIGELMQFQIKYGTYFMIGNTYIVCYAINFTAGYILCIENAEGSVNAMLSCQPFAKVVLGKFPGSIYGVDKDPLLTHQYQITFDSENVIVDTPATGYSDGVWTLQKGKIPLNSQRVYRLGSLFLTTQYSNNSDEPTGDSATAIEL